MAKLGKTTYYRFHYNAFPETFIKARALRKEMTEAERILWHEIRNRKIDGYKFRRQHPVGQFIVDFFCAEKALAIELDGGIHDDKNVMEKDENRTAELERLEIKVIRFKNEEVFTDHKGVLRRIREELHLTPTSHAR
jgi:very-short-patch-repair endonuclease